MAARKIRKLSIVTKKAEKPTAKESPLANKFSLKISKRYLLWGIVASLIVALLFFGRGFFIAAVVNGVPIPRISVIKELEAQGGRQTLDSLVIETLIRQEASKKGIVVSDKELEDGIKKIESSVSSQGQTLDALLAAQNRTRSYLLEQIRTQKLLEKMVGKDITITDQEITDYLEQNKEFFSESLSEEEKKKSAQQQLEQTRLGEKAQEWIKEARKNANIFYFVDY